MHAFLLIAVYCDVEYLPYAVFLEFSDDAIVYWYGDFGVGVGLSRAFDAQLLDVVITVLEEGTFVAKLFVASNSVQYNLRYLLKGATKAARDDVQVVLCVQVTGLVHVNILASAGVQYVCSVVLHINLTKINKIEQKTTKYRAI